MARLAGSALIGGGASSILVWLLAMTIPNRISAAAGAGEGSRDAVIYQTNNPFGGPFGIYGADVFQEQSVAVRFTPDDDYRLDRVGVWFMNNDDSGAHPLVSLTLRMDQPPTSIPTGPTLEQWTISVSAVGWSPVLERVNSAIHPMVRAGQNYWIAASSNSAPFINGVWDFAGIGTGMMSICNGDPCKWTPANSGGVAATVIEGTPWIPGDVDGLGAVNIDDLLAVINAWGSCPNCANALCAADFNNDCVVNIDDLLDVITHWSG